MIRRIGLFFFHLFYRFKWGFLALYLWMVLWSLFYLEKVEVSNSPEAFFPKNSPTVKQFLEFKKNYESRDFLIILYESDHSILTPEARTHSRKLGEKFAALPYSEYLISLDTITLPLSQETLKKIFPGWVAQFLGQFSSLFPPNLTQQQAEEILKMAPFLRGFLVSEDGKAGIILLFLKEVSESEKKSFHEVLIPAIENILNEEKSFKFAYFGTPRVHYELLNNVKKDERFFLPAAALMFVLILFFFFRSWIYVLLPLGIVVFALEILLGSMGYHEVPITALTALLPPLILVIGVASMIHILLCYAQKRTEEKSSEALYKTFMEMWTPCFWNTLTTMIGFGSLLISTIGPIQEFGVLSAIGCFLCFLFSMSAIPLFFPFLEKQTLPNKHILDSWISLISSLVLRFPRRIILIFFGFTLFGCYFIFFIPIESNFINYFGKETSIFKDAHYIQDRLGSVGTLEILATPKTKLSLPQQLKILEQFQADLKQTRLCRGVLSILDPLTALSQQFYRQPKLPEKEVEILQLVDYFLANSGNLGLGHLYQPDFKQYRFSFRLPLTSSAVCTQFVRELKQQLRGKYGDSFDIQITGASEAYLTIADQIVEQQISNFSLAFVLITLALTCIFGSFKIALFAMIPNIFPIIFTFGIMGLLKIELNTSTAMVASISIGMAVDNTVHFICRFKEELYKIGNYRQALFQSISSVGPAMTTSSVILMAGFGIVCFGSFVPTQQFGFLVCITLISALLADLLFLTSMMLVFQPKLLLEKIPHPSEETRPEIGSI
ncbi:MAG: MMPL family transporter [Planctomycetota bacterium]